MRRVVVTGGAGFLGSAVVRHLIRRTEHEVITLDALTYAGDLRALESVASHPRHRFERLDIRQGRAVQALFEEARPDAVIHLAAESHVDRSLDHAAPFVDTNVVGTATLLDVVRAWLDHPDGPSRDRFRFVHVSTDEVYGDLPIEGGERFDEESPYDPHSPYAASKAASDHLVGAWAHSWAVPAVITHGTNTYGPGQYPEKLIPVAILRALAGEPIPLFGSGRNVRDWIHVDDHASALVRILDRAEPGARFGIGARCEHANLAVVSQICALLDEIAPRVDGEGHAAAITFVADRPGHDRRYATDPSALETALGWSPEVGWAEGLRATVQWFVDHEQWCRDRLHRR
ncbi:dTDP-glucose 4,6-dehydratase [Gaopeijia maritima]|uniref:dTDP-glucose 4,6-dehydratase n=1 Tax=Gaopeijia maritima TaxID=3119007 RepID=UPI0032544A20